MTYTTVLSFKHDSSQCTCIGNDNTDLPTWCAHYPCATESLQGKDTGFWLKIVFVLGMLSLKKLATIPPPPNKNKTQTLKPAFQMTALGFMSQTSLREICCFGGIGRITGFQAHKTAKYQERRQKLFRVKVFTIFYRGISNKTMKHICDNICLWSWIILWRELLLRGIFFLFCD